jgi:hypothetical protein
MSRKSFGVKGVDYQLIMVFPRDGFPLLWKLAVILFVTIIPED